MNTKLVHYNAKMTLLTSSMYFRSQNELNVPIIHQNRDLQWLGFKHKNLISSPNSYLIEKLFKMGYVEIIRNNLA